jgi:hypothetical protein
MALAAVIIISTSRLTARRKRIARDVKDRLYASPADAQKQVREDYLYWTGRLADSSFQLSFALIAGNWAAFGSLERIMSNNWAKLSLALVILALAASLLGAYVLGQLHNKQLAYANENPERWVEEYKQCSGSNPWPFTKKIVTIGWLLRQVKTWLPLASGVCFLIALFVA